MAATPTLETVITAIKAAIDALGATIGTVYLQFHQFEDDVEFLRNKGLISSSGTNVWFIECAGIEESEGDAAGEIFELYQIEITYWSIRQDNDAWSKEARQKAEQVRDALAGASSIFAISGQRQLLAPETVRLISHGPRDIRAGEQGVQLVYETKLGLTVEARRWSA
jgi:hypothetical protein